MDKNRAWLRLSSFKDDLISSFSVLSGVKYNYVRKSVYHSMSEVYSGRFGIRRIDLSLATSFFDNNTGVVKEFDFVEGIMGLCHESYHVLQFSNQTDNDDMMSYLSRCYNTDCYLDNYNMFLYELSAERFALHETYDRLNQMYPMLNVRDILLDYVDARMGVNRDEYFITSDKRFSDIDSVFKAFDKAYDNALEILIPFDRYPNDCAGRVLSENGHLKECFNKIDDSAMQSRFVASIVLSEYPKLYHDFKFLKRSDYDLDDICENITKYDLIRKSDDVEYDNRLEICDIDRKFDDDFCL